MRVGGIEYPDSWFMNGTAEYQHFVYDYLTPYQQSAWGPYMKPLPAPAPNPTFAPEPPLPAPVVAQQAAVGTGCCLCQGGGARNYVPGAGDIPQGTGPGVPVLNIVTPQSEVARRIINAAIAKPVNTIVF